MSIRLELLNGILIKSFDDATRTVATYGATGQVTETRPYTAQENADADAAAQALADAEAARERTELADAILDAIAHTSASAHADGETWTAPTGAHDAYPLGATVTHNGRTWTSTTAANIWKPGVYGWV